MPDDTRPPAPGLRDAAQAVLTSGVGFVRARGELLQIEAEEARVHSRTISRFAVAGVVTFVTGYVLLLALGVHFAANSWLGGSWQLALFAVAAMHLFIGAVLLIAARTRAQRKPLFGATLDQFEIDHRWLGELQEELKKQS